MTKKRPNSMRHLDDSIRRFRGGSAQDFLRVRTCMANAIVAGMLPDGVVKGGSAIKMRYGDAATRFTTDLDTATAMDATLYMDKLNESLRSGWEGFTGRVAQREQASPKDVPTEYVMQPCDVKLAYLGRPWCTVPLEIGFNEIGDADKIDWAEVPDIADVFESIGFPSPGKVPLMPLNHQIAQKPHAVSGAGDRARDLVDLQLIVARSGIDATSTRKVCERLFAYRKAQAWPPTVLKKPGWDDLYKEQASGLPVLESIDDAIEWVNSLIQTICDAE